MFSVSFRAKINVLILTTVTGYARLDSSCSNGDEKEREDESDGRRGMVCRGTNNRGN